MPTPPRHTHMAGLEQLGRRAEQADNVLDCVAELQLDEVDALPTAWMISSRAGSRSASAMAVRGAFRAWPMRRTTNWPGRRICAMRGASTTRA